MKEYVQVFEKIRDRMTESDKKLLSDFYAPRVVAVPDSDPWGRLTVMPAEKL